VGANRTGPGAGTVGPESTIETFRAGSSGLGANALTIPLVLLGSGETTAKGPSSPRPETMTSPSCTTATKPAATAISAISSGVMRPSCTMDSVSPGNRHRSSTVT
jgi:hypothetical protein